MLMHPQFCTFLSVLFDRDCCVVISAVTLLTSPLCAAQWEQCL